MFLRCKVTKNNKYQLYPYENDDFTKKLFDGLFKLTETPEFRNINNDSTMVTYIQESSILNQFEFQNNYDNESIIKTYCKDIVNTFFSKSKSNNYNFRKSPVKK